MSFSHKHHDDGEGETETIVETIILDISIRELNQSIYRLWGKFEYNGKIHYKVLENNWWNVVCIRKKKDGTTVVEYKNPLLSDGRFTSYEWVKVQVDSFAQATSLFRQMGFTTNIALPKERVTILVDTILHRKWENTKWVSERIQGRLKFNTYLPHKRDILQIEAATRKEILRIIEELGISPDRLVALSPRDLFNLHNTTNS